MSTGETAPVDEFMVATAVLPEVHDPPGDVEVNVVVPFKQTPVDPAAPLIVPAEGAAVTVSSLVFETSEHPATFTV